MLFEDCAVRCTNAATDFDRHEQRCDGKELANSMAYGLDTLRSQLYQRAHQDVEEHFGFDSMLIPVSPLDTEMAANAEIEIYLTAQSADEVREQHFVDNWNWYAEWLGVMRLGKSFQEKRVRDQLGLYLRQSSEARSLAFSDVLVRSLPEARHIPLVLYRLFPIAARIVTAVAFGDHFRANELRNQQVSLLPGIADCHRCHGTTLDNGEKCQMCGNPVWQYKWLTEAD